MARVRSAEALSLRELEKKLSVVHYWACPSKGELYAPEKCVGKNLKTLHEFKYFFGGYAGYAYAELDHAKKAVHWKYFYPSQGLAKEEMRLAGSRAGYGTLAHVLLLKELADFHPEIMNYSVAHSVKEDRITKPRLAQLRAMKLDNALTRKGMNFAEYYAKSRDYARKRFGFELK